MFTEGRCQYCEDSTGTPCGQGVSRFLVKIHMASFAEMEKVILKLLWDPSALRSQNNAER